MTAIFINFLAKNDVLKLLKRANFKATNETRENDFCIVFFVKMEKVTITQCGNYENSLSHFFDKNFVKVTLLL